MMPAHLMMANSMSVLHRALIVAQIMVWPRTTDQEKLPLREILVL
jgi:hypothetical protein